MWALTEDAISEPFKRERLASLHAYEELYRATGNGLYAWAAFLYAEDWGGDFPDWIGTYLLTVCAQLLCTIPSAPAKERPHLVMQALGFVNPADSGRRRGRKAADSFDAVYDYVGLQIADDVLWHHEADGEKLTKDGALKTVAAEWRIGVSTVRRAWSDHKEAARRFAESRAAERTRLEESFREWREREGRPVQDEEIARSLSRHAPSERQHPCPVRRWGAARWAEILAAPEQRAWVRRGSRGLAIPSNSPDVVVPNEVINPRSRVTPPRKTRRTKDK